MRSAYEEFGFFGAVVRLSVGIVVVAVLFALLAVSMSGCGPSDPSTGELDLGVEEEVVEAEGAHDQPLFILELEEEDPEPDEEVAPEAEEEIPEDSR